MSEMKTVLKGISLNGYGSGTNVAEVDIKDGKILRVRPFHYYDRYDEESLNPWSFKKDGKEFRKKDKEPLPAHCYAYPRRIYSKNRILYPLRRVDWQPGGDPEKINAQNRGTSKYVRISWDEAAQCIADEITRVKETYGLPSILIQADGHGEDKNIHAAHGCPTHLIRLLGDDWTFQIRQPDSWEGWYWGAKHFWGGIGFGQPDFGNTMKDTVENCEMLLFWGCDMETTPWGWTGQIPSQLCFWFTEIGIKQVYICPDVNYGNAVHADKWIPVLPNTDAALHCAIAWIWLTEGTYEKDFVYSHGVGFDVFKDYILGVDDGVPKTPEWASPICGVPTRQIKALARQWAKQRTSIAHGNGGGLVRGAYSHEPARLEACLMAMRGLHKPGVNEIKFIEWNMLAHPTQMPMPRQAWGIFPKGASHCFPFDMRKSFIPKTLVPKALLGDYTAEHPLTWHSFPLAPWNREDQYKEFQYPIPGAEPIHMVWTDTPCWSTCWNCGNDMAAALRDSRIECVVAQQPWFENDCHYADILLPISTKFEEEDYTFNDGSGYVPVFYHEPQCIEPRGESKSDWEAVCEVAKKLGLYEELNHGRTSRDWVKVAFDASGAAERISYEDWLENGLPVPTLENWEDDPIGLAPFVDDPEANPLDTATGKLEFYSQALADGFPGDEERPPSPRYIHIGESHEERLDSERGKKYPYLLVSNHPRWRVHANMDDIPWLREIETCKVKGPDGYLYEPAWLHPSEAQKLGVENGDVVRIFNERGWTLGGVYVTERIMPHTVYQDHGARIDPIEPGVSDRGGANNLLAPRNITSKNAPGEVTNGYLVGVEKVDVFELAKQYPEAFNRSYDPYDGVDIAAWIEGRWED